MDIENINKVPFTVADEMLASGVPIFYCDESCDGTDLIIREYPDGSKELVKVDGEQITVVRSL
jgi:hypothetical protein